MKKIIYKILKKFMIWSYNRSITTYKEIPSIQIPLDQLQKVALDLFFNDDRIEKIWKYKNDGFLGLFNYVHAPYLAKDLNEGDCDDFASAMVWYSHRYNPYLLTYFTNNLADAHTVTILAYNNKVDLFDWCTYKQYESFDDLITGLESSKSIKIKHIFLAKFNYDKGMYEHVDQIKNKDIN